MFPHIIYVVLTILFLLCWFLIIRRLIGNRYASVKIVKAEVIDKYKVNPVSKMSGIFRRERCIVVFRTDKKKLSFPVSEFSYSSYEIKDKGTLKYKGDKIICFR